MCYDNNYKTKKQSMGDKRNNKQNVVIISHIGEKVQLLVDLQNVHYTMCEQRHVINKLNEKIDPI